MAKWYSSGEWFTMVAVAEGMNERRGKRGGEKGNE